MRVNVTIGSAPAGKVPENDQDDGQELQPHPPPHEAVAALAALDGVLGIARHAEQTDEQHAERRQARHDHQDEQDVGEGHASLHCHPERSEGPLEPQERFLATLGMTPLLSPRLPISIYQLCRPPPTRAPDHGRASVLASLPVATLKIASAACSPDHKAACTVPYSTGSVASPAKNTRRPSGRACASRSSGALPTPG